LTRFSRAFSASTIPASDLSQAPVSASSSAANWPTATAAHSHSSRARSARAARSSFAFLPRPACMPPACCRRRQRSKEAALSPLPRLRGRAGWGLVRLGRGRGEERDPLLDVRTAALWAGMLLLTLRVTAHHFEEIAALRALELINRHGADPPGTSHRSVAYKTTLFPSPARGGGPGWGPLFPSPPGGGQGGGCAYEGEREREYPK